MDREISQFFDEANGTSSWRYGLAADFLPHEDWRAGIEWTWRDIDEPGFFGSEVRTDAIDEILSKAYLYWMPTDRSAISIHIQYDDYERKGNLAIPRPLKVETITIPLEARYFHPSGFFVNWRTSWRYQSVDQPNLPPQFGELSEGHEEFFLNDLRVGYKFPNGDSIAAFEVNNLFDVEFDYQDESFRSPETISTIIPDRTFLFRLSKKF